MLIWLCQFNSSLYAQPEKNTSSYDLILKYRSFAEDRERSIKDREFFAARAVSLSREFGIDSVILFSNRILSSVYLSASNYDQFAKINYINLKLAQKSSDSLSFGIASHNLGFYHSIKLQNDSAYYYYNVASKIYDRLGEVDGNIDLLPNLATLQVSERDYFGAEGNAIKGLRLLANAPQTQSNLDSGWILNNLMGMISLALKQYDKSIDYHIRAQEIARKINDDILTELFSANNIAFVYRKKGEFAKSLSMYEQLLNTPNLFEIDPKFYALVLDNVAYGKLISETGDYEELNQKFKRAYHISDSLQDPVTKLGISIDLAKFYKKFNKLESAKAYAHLARSLSKTVSANDIHLESLLLLSELERSERGKSYLLEYIQLSDSLLVHERGIRNRFARVQFETDQIASENERIAAAKTWWIIISIILLMASILLYIVISQRNRNKELKFKQVQQEKNEEIYNLMLSQQDKLDGARYDEKQRISQELHDGILSRLFGTRLNLDSYNYSKDQQAATLRSKYISELKSIEEDIRQISHELNSDIIKATNFVDILKTLVKKQTEAYQLGYDFNSTEHINWDLVSNKSKINIYRIVQEVLHNIYKHAKAKHVIISLKLKGSFINIKVKDDGIGFENGKLKKGIGLKNILSRVEELNGSVDYNSSPGEGTTIKIKIPYSTLIA